MSRELKDQLSKYYRSVGHTTAEERGKCRAWVKVSGDPYSNPWKYVYEDGTQADYITSYRHHIQRSAQIDDLIFDNCVTQGESSSDTKPPAEINDLPF